MKFNLNYGKKELLWINRKSFFEFLSKCGPMTMILWIMWISLAYSVDNVEKLQMCCK